MHLKRSYLAFYWPLALMGLATMAGGQFQNGVLARYPNAVQELAIFAFATGTFHLFTAAMGFVPQMTNVLARTSVSRRKCLEFVVVVCVVMTVPPAFLAFSAPGKWMLGRIYGIDGRTLDSVVRYLRYLLPHLHIWGQGSWCMHSFPRLPRTSSPDYVPGSAPPA